MTQDEFNALAMIGASATGLAAYALGRTVFKPRRGNEKTASRGSDPSNNNTVLFGTAENEDFTIGDALEGIAIFGGPGSGKSSTSGELIAKGMLKHGFSGLVLTAKTDEADRWRRMCRQMGREKDLIVFDSSGKHAYNFLQHQINEAGATSATDNVVLLLEEMGQVVDRLSGNGGSNQEEAFWVQGARRLARNTIDLIRIAGGKVTMPFILDVLQEASASSKQFHDPVWRANSVIFDCIAKGETVEKSPIDTHDFAIACRFWRHEFFAIAEKSRSILLAKTLGVIDPLSRGLLSFVFDRESTFDPGKAAEENKIIVADFPIKSFGTVGALAQTIVKVAFQKGIESKPPGKRSPAFLWIDEAQNFLTARDQMFASTSRSARCANVWLTQNVSNILCAVGAGDVGKATADSLLALCNTKVFHANSDPLTNQFAADLIGKRKKRMPNFNASPAPHDPNSLVQPQRQVSAGMSTSYEYAVHPHEFISLTKPNEERDYAEAIIVSSGRRFSSTNDVYLWSNIRRP